MSDSEEVIVIGADVDVSALMADVHAAIKQRRDAGAYPPEVLEELDTVLGAGLGDDQLRRAIGELQRSSGFSADITTASRKPLVAPAVAGAKRAIRASVRWYLIGILQQIRTFAGHVVRSLGLVADRLRRAEDRLDELDARTAADTAQLRDELTSLREELRAPLQRITDENLYDRLAQFDRAVRDLRQRLEAAGATASSGGAPAERPGARSWKAERELDYFQFENRFRGSLEEIADRQRRYVELFTGLDGPVVDLGFGRGEFLTLLDEAGVGAYGVDRHPDMVAFCRERGLRVQEGDALEHLASVEPKSLAGVFAAQMIEHLDPPEVVRFFELAADALRPGGVLVAETINPESLFVFAHAFYVDLGHLRPLHPLTLEFLAQTAGFAEVRVDYLSPPPPEFRPMRIESAGRDDLDPVIEKVNENFRRIDEILFGPQDYAVVAVR